MPKEETPAGMLTVVCCLAGWLPQCRRVEPVLEQLNGEVLAKEGDVAGGGGASSARPEYQLTKVDMSESRFLRDRHNINTLPMYLMYYNGRLAYASNTLNGYGTSKEDLVAQVRETTNAAQRGAFLPDDFRFGSTDNRMVDRFSATLGATAPTLGAS